MPSSNPYLICDFCLRKIYAQTWGPSRQSLSHLSLSIELAKVRSSWNSVQSSQNVGSPCNRTHCYPELCVSSQRRLKRRQILIAPDHGGMAGLSGLDKYLDGIPAEVGHQSNRARRSLALLMWPMLLPLRQTSRQGGNSAALCVTVLRSIITTCVCVNLLSGIFCVNYAP